ncbi:MAG: PSD1 and planctomycete cytochrome C domain-containing protein [Planctomycetales bacterium]
MRLSVTLMLLVSGVIPPAAGFAEEAEDKVDYVQDVKPILSQRCYACHGALKQKNSLRLDTAALARQGGDGGPAVTAGKSGESLLIDAVTGANGVPRMPPEGEPLKPEEIETLRRWIDQGAHAPEEKVPQNPAQHWSYQPPQCPPLPLVADPAWRVNPIDAFVASQQEQRGLTHSPPASKSLLLRRVYLDLIGLPPTRAEMVAFLADESPEAYEKVVDRLLESPHYGERWGRHWMDVWRYSDWDGYGAEIRESQPHIWRWRDWIVESLNADKPYDQMIVEMLAGDEVAPSDPDTIRATGFLARNWYKFNRNVWLDFTIEHTAKAFLGTTMNCARCHDHMYDPLTQQDYYKFRALFETHDVRADRLPGKPDPLKDGLARVFDSNVEAPTYLYIRGDEKRPDKEHPLPAGIPAVLSRAELKIEPVKLAPVEFYPGLRPFVQQENLQQAQVARDAAHAKWTEAHTLLAAARQKLTDHAAAKTAASEKKEPVGDVILADDFSSPKPELWNMGPGTWEYKEGGLVQSDPRDAVTPLISVKPHPADFVGRIRFKTTGGKVYKSVGLSFDANAGADQDFWGVYLSGANKLSIFQRKGGQDVYFPDGAKDFPVELNREYELQVAVRGALVNVSVDGKLSFTYKLPAERLKEGRFALWTYDATAQFVRASIATLPADYVLYEKLSDSPAAASESELQLAIAQAQQTVALADKALATATAALAWTHSRIAADNANYAIPPAVKAQELSLAAGRAEREHALRLAEQNLLQAEQKLAAARALPNPEADAAKKAIADGEAAVTAATKPLHDAQAALAQPLEAYTRFGPVYPATSSGRRLALARWIADRSNPLTARVAINHLWLRHMGSPLVSSVFDFGLNGKPPTHPELLDWLAVELMEPTVVSGAPPPGPPLLRGGNTGWRMKHIHRLIVTSQTYRQQSATSGPVAQSCKPVDPDNVSLWRMNVRRMEAEIIRDSTLYVAGKLDPTMGGADLDENSGMTVPRRSLYFRNSKEKKMTFLDLFDRPNVVECYRRPESIVPQQALAMANSPLSLAQARHLAKSLSEEAGPENASDKVHGFVSAAFQQILNRPPTGDERTECEAFLKDQTARFANPQGLTQFTAGTASPVPPAADPHQRARENLVHVLLNHNDFLTVR